MKLVSIDVGLRNLAVCVLEGTSRADVRITHWDVIDILGERNGVARPLCFHCGKAAMWQQGDDKFACTRHCPKVKVPTKTVLGKKKVEELRTQAMQLGISAEDLPARKPELVNAVHQKLKGVGWIKFSGGSAIRHQPVLDLAGDLATSLGNRDAWWKDTTLVVIENQKDRRMFAVQAMLTMFFVTRGFRVKGVSAVHKLNNVVTLDSTATYKGRKKTGIIHCEQLMPAENRAFFRSHKKKDDLADSFLQGLWFLEH